MNEWCIGILLLLTVHVQITLCNEVSKVYIKYVLLTQLKLLQT
jgi:hypothetical protein